MSTPEVFDPYRKWLGIPPADQPPNHYRLLGVGLFEDDADTIAIAADRQMAHIRTFQTGPHSALSQKLLNELAAARLTLLDGKKKTAYDAQLYGKLAETAKTVDGAGQGRGAPPPVPAAAPIAAANDPPRGSAPIAPIVIAATPAQQGRGAEASRPPAVTILEGAVAASSRRPRRKRWRSELALWSGVAAALVVLAAVVYVAREQIQNEVQSIEVASQKRSSPATASARSSPRRKSSHRGERTFRANPWKGR